MARINNNEFNQAQLNNIEKINGDYFLKVLQTNPQGDFIDVQTPLPTDGDSVYKKDIWLDESITTDWSDKDSSGDEIAYIPFNNLHTHIENSTSDNPKTLTIHFKRTVSAHQVGMGCYSEGNFSNVKISLLGSSGSVRTVVDDSTNDTKYNSRDYKFEPQLFNSIKIEFYTADTVCISNITIQKSTNTESFIRAQSDLTNEVEPIKSYKGALQVDSALVHEKGINLFFFRELTGSTTVDTTAEINDTTLTVVDAIPFSVGDKIRVTTDVEVGQSFITITDITGNVITLDRPLSSTISAGAPVKKYQLH